MATNVSTNLSPFLTLAEQAVTPSNPASGSQKLFIPTGSHQCTGLTSSGATAAIGGGGGGGSYTDAASHLSSDVTLGINSMTDVLAVTLAAGTWLLIGKATIALGSHVGGDHVTVELWDGSTHIDSGQVTQAVSWLVCIPLLYKVTPGSTTTYKIRATAFFSAGTAVAACPQNGVGSNATTLYAFKYA